MQKKITIYGILLLFILTLSGCASSEQYSLEVRMPDEDSELLLEADERSWMVLDEELANYMRLFGAGREVFACAEDDLAYLYSEVIRRLELFGHEAGSIMCDHNRDFLDRARFYWAYLKMAKNEAVEMEDIIIIYADEIQQIAGGEEIDENDLGFLTSTGALFVKRYGIWWESVMEDLLFRDEDGHYAAKRMGTRYDENGSFESTLALLKKNTGKYQYVKNDAEDCASLLMRYYGTSAETHIDPKEITIDQERDCGVRVFHSLGAREGDSSCALEDVLILFAPVTTETGDRYEWAHVFKRNADTQEWRYIGQDYPIYRDAVEAPVLTREDLQMEEP